MEKEKKEFYPPIDECLNKLSQNIQNRFLDKLDDSDINEIIRNWQYHISFGKLTSGLKVDLVSVNLNLERGNFDQIAQLIDDKKVLMDVLKSSKWLTIIQDTPLEENEIDFLCHRQELRFPNIDPFDFIEKYLGVRKDRIILDWLDERNVSLMDLTKSSDRLLDFIRKLQLSPRSKLLQEIRRYDPIQMAQCINKRHELSLEDLLSCEVDISTLLACKETASEDTYPYSIFKLSEYNNTIEKAQRAFGIDTDNTKLIVAARWFQEKYPDEWQTANVEEIMGAYGDELSSRVVMPRSDWEIIAGNPNYFYLFYNTFGTEIEPRSTVPRNILVALKTLDRLGFKSGEGGRGEVDSLDYYEFSPEYFIDPITHLAVHYSSLSVMAADTQFNQSLHVNFGSKYPFFIPALTRYQHACSYLFRRNLIRYQRNDPSNASNHILAFNSKQTDKKIIDTLELHPKPSIKTDYIFAKIDHYFEVKNFQFTTWENFVTGIQHIYLQLASIKALQYVEARTRIANIKTGNTCINEIYNWANIKSQIDNTVDDKYARNLAHLAADAFIRLEEGYQIFGLEGILRGSVARNAASDFYDQIEFVVHQPEDYYKDPAEKRTNPQVIRGIEFSNIVHFSRYVSDLWTAEIVKVFNAMKQEYFQNNT